MWLRPYCLRATGPLVATVCSRPALQWQLCAPLARSASQVAAADGDAGAQGSVRAFADRVAEEHGITGLDGWKKVRRKDLLEAGGNSHLRQHKQSVFSLLRAAYPELGDFEQFECRPRVRRGYWKVAENQRKFLDAVADRHGVREAADWKRVSFQDIVDMGGAQLLQEYPSVADALCSVYPDRYGGSSVLELRANVSRRYWSSTSNQRQFMDHVANVLDVRAPGEWAKVRYVDVLEQGGAMLLEKYGSLHATLVAVYPEHADELSAFQCRDKMPNGFWASEENVVAFIHMAAKKLAVAEVGDWRRVSVEQVLSVGGSGLLRRMKLKEALAKAYPRHDWSNWDSDASAKKSSQRALHSAVHNLFSCPPAATVAASM